MLKLWTVFTEQGWVAAAGSDLGLAALTLPGAKEQDVLDQIKGWLKVDGYITRPLESDDNLSRLPQMLNQYFRGQEQEFNFPLDLSIYTPFQQKVLRVVWQIPYGTVLSYGEVGALCGLPRAARAVGRAVGSNKHLLVIPCHRVVRSDGGLGGFGQGLDWKTRLLSLEGIVLRAQ